MHKQDDLQALASVEQVLEIALVFIRMSEAIHHALRKLSGITSSNAATPYALLTEEYALRSRANILMIEAGRFARPGLEITQQEMLNTLESIYTNVNSACTLDELAELIIVVVLFANSIASMQNHIVSFILNELKKLSARSSLTVS